MNKSPHHCLQTSNDAEKVSAQTLHLIRGIICIFHRTEHRKRIAYIVKISADNFICNKFNEKQKEKRKKIWHSGTFNICRIRALLIYGEINFTMKFILNLKKYKNNNNKCYDVKIYYNTKTNKHHTFSFLSMFKD